MNAPRQVSKTLFRVLSPLLYLAVAALLFAPLGALAGYVEYMHPSLYERLATPRGVLLFTAIASFPFFAAATMLLLRLEGIPRPSVWDHLRQAALWYLLGLLYWPKLLSNPRLPDPIDSVAAAFALAAIVANLLAMLALQIRTVRLT